MENIKTLEKKIEDKGTILEISAHDGKLLIDFSIMNIGQNPLYIQRPGKDYSKQRFRYDIEDKTTTS